MNANQVLLYHVCLKDGKIKMGSKLYDTRELAAITVNAEKTHQYTADHEKGLFFSTCKGAAAYAHIINEYLSDYNQLEIEEWVEIQQQ